MKPLFLLTLLPSLLAASPYEIQTYPLPKDLKLEASGLAALPDGSLAIAIRKGEIWILETPTDPDKATFRQFATGLHEPLGLAFRDGALFTTQRSEVTRLRDTDGDGRADEYLTAAKGWGVSGNYHEYAYGPAFDNEGNLWVTLNATLGPKPKISGHRAADTPWRGWSMAQSPGGKLEPMSAGLRSPMGIAANAEGDIFATDQQGNWWGTNPLLHLKRGAFHGHADSLTDAKRPGSPVKDPGKLPNGITTAEAIANVPGYTPPAVWFPYTKMGCSTTGLHIDDTGGKFGPFENQFFVGEFTLAQVNRAYLEKVDGEYQGACFPFLDGFQSAVLQVAFLDDGSMVVGQSNRGWNSLGTRSYGLQRVVWNGETPFEIKAMNATPTGFRLTLTQPADPASASDPASYKMSSYTHHYHSSYGSPEIDTKPVPITAVAISDDHLTVTITCQYLRPGHIHELHLDGLKNISGSPLLHPRAYYTLNRIPKP